MQINKLGTGGPKDRWLKRTTNYIAVAATGTNTRTDSIYNEIIRAPRFQPKTSKLDLPRISLPNFPDAGHGQSKDRWFSTNRFQFTTHHMTKVK
jgi:hypothetical protein